MATVAELAARDHRDIAFLLVIEGLPWAWTDRSEIAGTGAGSWIGEDYGAREVLEGLTVPETIGFATNAENGTLASDDGASFTIRDFDRRMIGLVDATNTGTVIGQTLGPKDDPAPTSILDAFGNLINPRGRWLNHEAIGPTGERRHFGCMPIAMPGLDHAAWSTEVQTLAPSILRDDPVWYEGTRCALYIIYRDCDTGEWPSWQDQHDSGASLLWWGTTTELTCEALTWTMECEGPSSWLRRQLGGNRSPEWRPVGTSITLATDAGADQHLAAYYFSYRTTTLWERGAGSYYVAADALPTTGTATDFRSAIQTRLNTVAATAGPDTTWSTARTASCLFLQGRIEMQVGDFSYAAYAYVCLHERVWRVLGFDPKAQAGTIPGGDPLVVDFIDPAGLAFELAPFAAVPGSGYYLARLSTIPAQYDSLAAAGTDADNNGTPRSYDAIHIENLTTLYPGGNQEIRVGLGPGSAPYLEGQLCRAPTEYTMSNTGGAVDSMAFVALRGSLKTDADADVVTMGALARVGFHDDASFGGHGPGPDADGYLKLWIQEYIEPRFVGIDRKFTGPWSSLDLAWCPANLLGYNTKNGDRADLVLLRTMLSTGTASWAGYDGQGAVQTLGANAHPDADAPQGSDVEIADLGLAIPADLIDAASFVATANALPKGGKNSGLNLCKFAWLGSFDSQAFVWGVLEQRGWGMGLVGGQYRLFPRAQVLDPGDVEVAFGPDDFAADADFVEVADLRPFLPIDGWQATYGAPLIEGTGSDEELTATVSSIDPQSRSRRTNNVSSQDGRGLIPVRLWDDEPGAPASWIPAWSQLFGRELGDWFTAPWMTVDIPVRWSIGRQIGPGSVVSLSSHYAPNREGTYGLSNRIGRVLSTTINLEDLSVVARVLVQPGDPGALRRFAPVACVLDTVSTVEARHDAVSQTFYCYADFFEHGDDAHDVAWFAEPSWSTVGGQAIVWGWQWDGRTWAQTLSLVVDTVDTAANSITYKSMTGTWHEAQPTVLMLAPYDSQTPGKWPQAVFSVITDSDGTFGSGPTVGFPLVDQ